MRRSAGLAVALCALVTPSLAGAAAAAPAAATGAAPAAKGDAVARLHDLFDREWAWRLREYPELASAVGVHDYDDRLSDLAPETLARQTRESAAFRAELERIDRGALPPAEQANFDIFDAQLDDRIQSYGFAEQDLTVNADSGFHSGFALLWQTMPFDSVKGY